MWNILTKLISNVSIFEWKCWVLCWRMILCSIKTDGVSPALIPQILVSIWEQNDKAEFHIAIFIRGWTIVEIYAQVQITQPNVHVTVDDSS